MQKQPLIVHVVHRFDIGGLENGVVNLINGLHAEPYRHAIVCLTDYTDFRSRLEKDIPIFPLHKREGNDPLLLFRLWSVLRKLRPTIVHTRNLATLEAQLPAFLAGVRCRVHGEHGRDVHDLDGTRRKYQVLRRLFRPLVHRYVSVSQDLETYLEQYVGVPGDRISRIPNGVDTEAFHANAVEPRHLKDDEFLRADNIVIGTVGRMETVKDQATLARAFVELVKSAPALRSRLRLVMIGEGTQRQTVQKLLDDAESADISWLPGAREDVPELMRCLDVFVLPSLAEGMSNTILEAMATGLPVIATRVGGNGELVVEGETGFLVPRGDPLAMATAIARYLDNPALISRHGLAARKRVEQHFSIDEMVCRYADLYDGLLQSKGCVNSMATGSVARS